MSVRLTSVFRTFRPTFTPPGSVTAGGTLSMPRQHRTPFVPRQHRRNPPPPPPPEPSVQETDWVIKGLTVIGFGLAVYALIKDEMSPVLETLNENQIMIQELLKIAKGFKNKAKKNPVKVLILGDSGVGKSSIVHRFVRGEFDPTLKVSVGVTCLSQPIEVKDYEEMNFEIWDTLGQKRYATPLPLYYRGAKVAVIAYDITNVESFTEAQYWVKELKKYGSADMVLALVGCKSDLQVERKVSFQVGIGYARRNGLFFIETSSKTADNINSLFEEIAKRVQKVETANQGLKVEIPYRL